MMLQSLCFLVVVAISFGDNGGILQIHYPNISIEADKNGSVYMKTATISYQRLISPYGTNLGLHPIYSRLSLSRSRRDPLKHFEISVLRQTRFAELRKIPTELPNFTNEHSGNEASVYVLPGPGGTVYYEGEDLLQIIELINGLPPVWKDHSATGFFTTRYGGTMVNVKLEALDPQNGKLDYKVVAGSMPPGLRLESNNSRIYGRVPDIDGLYSFTVRVTNADDKYADAVFRMEIIETNQCVTNNPCRHGAQCVDTIGEIGYQCYCADQYSGQDCEISCSSNQLGIHNRSLIPDAQMSGYQSQSNILGSAGRLDGSGKGWCGTNANSWLQVDLGATARIFSSEEQSYSSSYYTGSYYLSYSTDGSHFDYVYQTNSTTAKQTIGGSTSSSSNKANLPTPITARFVRFHPVSYSSSYYPCMKVELNGCFI